MHQRRREVEFYEKTNGRCPTREFLDDLLKENIEDVVFIENAIKQLEIHGHKLPRPQASYLRDKIYELRIKTNHGQYRLLYFFYNDKIIIITHAIKKYSEKVRDSEIDKAIEFRSDYIRNHTRMQKR